MRRLKFNTYYWLFVSLAISFIIQFIGVVYYRPLPITPDGKEYLSISGNLLHGKGYSSALGSPKGDVPTRMRQPVYPLFLIPFYWLAGQNIRILQLAQIGLNALTLWLLFLIASNAFGKKLWGGTLLGLGLYIPLWLMSVFVMTETLFTFLLVLFMFLLQRAVFSENKTARFALCGALLGLSLLTRPAILPLCFLGFFPVWLHLGLRKALLDWGTLWLAFLAVLAPWFIRNAVVLGDYTPLSSEGGVNLWYASIPDTLPIWYHTPPDDRFDSAEFKAAVQQGYYKDSEADRRFKKMALEHIKSDPWGYIKGGLLRVVGQWCYFPRSRSYRNNRLIFSALSLVQIAFLLFAVLGLTGLDKARAAYFLVPAASISCVIFFSVTVARYLIPTMPFVLILSAQGLWQLIQRIFKVSSSQSNSRMVPAFI